MDAVKYPDMCVRGTIYTAPWVYKCVSGSLTKKLMEKGSKRRRRLILFRSRKDTLMERSSDKDELILGYLAVFLLTPPRVTFCRIHGLKLKVIFFRQLRNFHFVQPRVKRFPPKIFSKSSFISYNLMINEDQIISSVIFMSLSMDFGILYPIFNGVFDFYSVRERERE